MKKYLILIIFTLRVISHAKEHSISGDVGYNFFYLDGIEDNYKSDVNASTFITYYTDDYFSIVSEIEAIGSLKVIKEAEMNNIAPIELSMSQLYMNFFIDDLIFYIGKKAKRVGSANWFNISNRISPTYSSFGSTNNSALGMVDIEFMKFSNLNMGLVAYFNNSENWENISIAPNLSLSLINLDMDVFIYFEELDNVVTTFNISSQLGRFHIFFEGKVEDYTDIDLVLGTTYLSDIFSITGELLYGEDNLYGVLRFSRSNLIIDNLSISITSLNSIPDSTEDFFDYYSMDATLSLSYLYKDLLFTGYLGRYFGGDESEYILLDSADFTIGLFTTIYF